MTALNHTILCGFGKAALAAIRWPRTDHEQTSRAVFHMNPDPGLLISWHAQP